MDAPTSEGGDVSNGTIRELFIEELEGVQGGGADSGVSAIDTTQACCEEIFNPTQCCL